MGFLSSLFTNKTKQQTDPFELGFFAADMHSHFLPGIDDGSKSMDDTLAMLAKMEALGYQKVVTTPHIMSEVYPNSAETILPLLDQVRNEAQKAGIKLEIDAAAEYYFDDSFLEKIRKKEVLSFVDNYVLTEFSFHTAPSFESELFFELQMNGYKPVLAHFERYVYFHGSVEKAMEYRDKGVNIQLNLNSLTGHYGPDVKKQAEKMIQAGIVDFVGTDCHRIQHLMLLESQLTNPLLHELKNMPLKNPQLIR